MRRLILMRHAKSSWAKPGLADIDRPLNGRGRDAAQRMAAYLADEGYEIDRILCSAAQRTRETLARMLPWVPGDYTVIITRELYEGEWGDYLIFLRSAPAAVETILVIGHNPTIQELALVLCRDPGSAAARAMAEKFPTAAIAVLDFDVEDWADIGPGKGIVADFRRPRDLVLVEDVQSG
ncbi:MAG: histidine phosphatase family protein [Hyphomicrobiales bacterium]|nr:histidine phosphatase family protein [Hyphomicrobiales bacterium]